MSTLERNATISGTFLGREDHNIPTAMIYVADGGGGEQGFGGYSLRHYPTFVQDVLDTLGVEKWEALKGVNCRVRANNTKITAIGHIVKDRWFTPAVA